MMSMTTRTSIISFKDENDLGKSNFTQETQYSMRKPTLLKKISVQSNAIYVNQIDERAQKGGSGLLFIIYKQSNYNETDYQFKNELFMPRV